MQNEENRNGAEAQTSTSPSSEPSEGRELTGHKVNPANDRLRVAAIDEPGKGGACHYYQVNGYDPDTNPATRLPVKFSGPTVFLPFQNGPINEVGVNGITNEVLLEIVIDRLRGFQSGPFACRDNALALTKLEEAKHWLQARTLERMARGVEGTHKV